MFKIEIIYGTFYGTIIFNVIEFNDVLGVSVKLGPEKNVFVATDILHFFPLSDISSAILLIILLSTFCTTPLFY